MSYSIQLFAFNHEKVDKVFSDFVNWVIKEKSTPVKKDGAELRSAVIKEFYTELEKNGLYIPWVRYEK